MAKDGRIIFPVQELDVVFERVGFPSHRGGSLCCTYRSTHALMMCAMWYKEDENVLLNYLNNHLIQGQIESGFKLALKDYNLTKVEASLPMWDANHMYADYMGTEVCIWHNDSDAKKYTSGLRGLVLEVKVVRDEVP